LEEFEFLPLPAFAVDLLTGSPLALSTLNLQPPAG
jgi:hypothetical protein